MTTPASHIWSPSNARYVQINGFLPVARGPLVPPPVALAWPAKDPGDTLDYIFDIAPALTANPSDTISTLDVSINPSDPGDLVLSSASVDGQKAVLWLSGGQSGTGYTVTIKITTASGRALARSISLFVTSLASIPAPAQALTTPSGQVLTDPTGTPITTL